MPKVSLTQENKQQQNTQYPKLTLEHGERALIVLIETEPEQEYRHILEAPEIGPDGKVLKEERKKKDGSPYETTKKEFVGQHLCFGDFNVMSEKGADPDNCPTCAAAKENDGIGLAKPHYALHVIKYSLQPGGWTLRDPFNVECLAWVFSPSRLNTLIDFATEWGNLMEHDLKLGPCENKGYQKYDINVANSAQWLLDEKRKDFVAQTYVNNKTDDLSALIARRITKPQALEDIQKVLERYEQLTNPGSKVTVPDLSAVQNQKAETQDVFSPLTATERVATETFAVDTTTGEVTASQPAVAKKMDFADILKDL